MAAKDDEPAKDDKKGEKGEKGAEEKKLSPSAQRQQERREEKLKMIKEQVADGSLTVRQMTPEERAANPPKPPKQRRKR